MPNGGGDCCGTCPFNEVLSDPDKRPGWEAAGRGYCSIRKTRIATAFWTYCLNWHTKSPEPDGPILSCGHPEPGQTFPRIPWHGHREPQLGRVDGDCVMCGGSCADGILRQGIRVEDDDGEKVFCCNGHYVEWWKDRHPDERGDYWSRDWPEPHQMP